MSPLAFELISCVISLAAFLYGMVNLCKKEVPLYFKLYALAVGCYALEEIWVVVNTIFGTESSFVSVRLFGTFGFFCFILSANYGGFDKVTDERTPEDRKARLIARIAPLFLFALCILSDVLSYSAKPLSHMILELIVLSPTFPAAYLCLKHRLLPADHSGVLKATLGTDIVSLLLFLVNSVYLFRFLDTTHLAAYCCDIIMSVMVALMMVFSVWGAKKWKALL